MDIRERPTDILWGLQHKDIQELKKARGLATNACSALRRLCEGLTAKSSNLAASGIMDFLDRNSGQHRLWNSLYTIGHLIEPVERQVSTPGWGDDCRGVSGHMLPSVQNLVPRKSAHDAGYWIYQVFGSYFEGKAFDCLTFQGFGALLTAKPHAWQLDAVDAVINAHWPEILEELMPLTGFDSDAVNVMIEAESRAAIERREANTIQFVARQNNSAQEPKWLTVSEAATASGATKSEISNTHPNLK